ncbi:hypothetical protein JK358_35700 [Nocardia sp. 2]|uniref:PE family protein n=1 Tax=Nocardia acididurans TaxID=2802282 RepID=A0ABS1MGH0_9NOCA|nr:hypothetical protein [Nocardia acididurans]MBL1079760.1 hypothetical protein [Nocardia acididurans]
MLDIDSPDDIRSTARQFVDAVESVRQSVLATTSRLRTPEPSPSPIDRRLADELTTLRTALDDATEYTARRARSVGDSLTEIAGELGNSDARSGAAIRHATP